jgi:hypothetical protein
VKQNVLIHIFAPLIFSCAPGTAGAQAAAKEKVDLLDLVVPAITYKRPAAQQPPGKSPPAGSPSDPINPTKYPMLLVRPPGPPPARIPDSPPSPWYCDNAGWCWP